MPTNHALLNIFLQTLIEGKGCPYPHGIPAREILFLSKFAKWLDELDALDKLSENEMLHIIDNDDVK